jgi:hypothetical protein
MISKSTRNSIGVHAYTYNIYIYVNLVLASMHRATTKTTTRKGCKIRKRKKTNLPLNLEKPN